jgi:hypothetical protein
MPQQPVDTGRVPSDNSFTGVALPYQSEVYGPDERCGACANCQAEGRDAELATRAHADGMAGLEILGRTRPCLRVGQPKPRKSVRA